MTTSGTTLMEALVGDAEARSAFRADPDGFANRFGMTLDDETRAALLTFDWSGENVELLRRVSKGCCFTGSDARLKTNIRPLV